MAPVEVAGHGGVHAFHVEVGGVVHRVDHEHRALVAGLAEAVGQRQVAGQLGGRRTGLEGLDDELAVAAQGLQVDHAHLGRGQAADVGVVAGEDQLVGLGGDLGALDDFVAAGVQHQHLVLQAVQRQAEAAVLGEAQRPQALAGLDHLAHLEAAGVDHGDAAGLAVADVKRAGQWRDGQRQRARAGFDVFQLLQGGDVHHRHPTGITAADEGMPRVGAEGDFVMAATGGQGRHGLAGLGVDHGDAAFFATPGIVAHPEVAAIGLQRHAHRLGSGGQVAQHLELADIHHRHFAGAGHGNVEQAVVGAGDPVHRRTLEGDAGQGAGDAAHRGHRVDHGEGGILVHHHQVVAVQVHQRTGAEHALEVGADAHLALVRLDFRQRLVEPGARHLPSQGLAGGGIGEAQADIGEHPFGKHALAAQWPGLELDGHAVAHQTIGRVGGLLGGTGRGGQRGNQQQTGSSHLASPLPDLALIREQCLCHATNDRQFNRLHRDEEKKADFSPLDSPLVGKRRFHEMGQTAPRERSEAQQASPAQRRWVSLRSTPTYAVSHLWPYGSPVTRNRPQTPPTLPKAA
ncbi:hypothetical protein D9M71_253740 [compost metagenome]